MSKWSDETDPVQLVAKLVSPRTTVPLSDRKMRLLMCARAARQRYELGPNARAALDFAYKYAEGTETYADLEKMHSRWRSNVGNSAYHRELADINPCAYDMRAALVKLVNSQPDGLAELIKAIFYDPRKAPLLCNGLQLLGQDGKAIYQKDVVANFHGTYPYGHARWRTSRVVQFAEQLYELQDPIQYLALVDMMEEDGCDSHGIMRALRNPVCIKGFWALDFILGRE
jgi:hypothetical protein